jgi:hypothetical protein
VKVSSDFAKKQNFDHPSRGHNDGTKEFRTTPRSSTSALFFEANSAVLASASEKVPVYSFDTGIDV